MVRPTIVQLVWTWNLKRGTTQRNAGSDSGVFYKVLASFHYLQSPQWNLWNLWRMEPLEPDHLVDRALRINDDRTYTFLSSFLGEMRGLFPQQSSAHWPMGGDGERSNGPSPR